MLHEGDRHRARQARDAREEAVPPRGEWGLQTLAAGDEPERPGHLEGVGELVRLEGGEPVGEFGGVVARAVVLEEQFAVASDPGDQFLHLEAQEPAIGPELDHVGVDLVPDAHDHLHALRHRHDVPHGHQVLDLEGRERGEHLVEPALVPLERGERLVRLRQQQVRALEHVADAADVQGDDAHRLRHRDDRVPRLAGDPLGRAMAHPRLQGLDRGIREELDVGAADPAGGEVHHHGTVHLGQLAEAGRGELDIELESAGAECVDPLVVTEDHDGPGPATQDALEPVPQVGPGRHRHQRRSQV